VRQVRPPELSADQRRSSFRKDDPSRVTRGKRIAFVVQRCGLEVNGGAESLCLQIAQRMARHWTTEVITTCALDYMSWENFYEPGTEQIGSTSVRRFPVDQLRNVEDFNRLSEELHSRQDKATLAEQENWMRAQGPMSARLLEYLRANKESYDAFIFFGYLYATTYFGLPVVQEKALLEPLAHDEWTIHFKMWDAFFSLPEGFIFNTQAERSLLQRRFPSHSLPGPIAGVGIAPLPQIDVESFKSRYELNVPFLLYVGRIDESKGCRVMFEYFIRWKREVGAPHKLVLIGKEVMPIPFHDDIIHLGFVGDEEKWAAMKSCDWLIMPSPHESLSMVLLEAWSVGRPALVNGACAVLTEHCRESNGGLWYDDFDGFNTVLSTVDERTKQVLGRQGRGYVKNHYSWDRVESRYLEALKLRV
jgi:glycosyltransferase involved in cell wall biosynthesis